MAVSVAIILVNWNRTQDTLECLQSLRKSSYQDLDIIVVDNGSSADSLSPLRQLAGQITLIETGENLGFTGGNNIGIACALERSAEYIFLLNNDTVVAPDAIQNLLGMLEADTSIALVTPKILFYQPANHIWYGGASFNRRFLTSRMLGYGEVDRGQCDEEKDVEFASGCALLVRRCIFHEVGLLDDDFFAVGEDLDFCLRVTAHKYRIRYVPSAVVWHKESVSAGGQDAPQYIYYQTRNGIILGRKWSPNAVGFAMSVSYRLAFAAKRTLRLFLQRKWGSIIGIMIGLRDGFIHRTGRRDYRIL